MELQVDSIRKEAREIECVENKAAEVQKENWSGSRSWHWMKVTSWQLLNRLWTLEVKLQALEWAGGGGVMVVEEWSQDEGQKVG